MQMEKKWRRSFIASFKSGVKDDGCGEGDGL